MALRENLTHLSTWILGLCAAIYFLQKFEAELKPLVLAFIFVSILEWAVQCFEWIFQKSFTFLQIFLWKLYLVVGLCFVGMFSWFGNEKAASKVQDLRHEIVTDWGDLFKKWKGSDAGGCVLFRFMAVGLTLTLVGFFAILVNGIVQSEVAVALGKFGLYKTQLSSIAAFLGDMVTKRLPELPDLLPVGYRPEATKAIQDVQANIGQFVSELPTMVEGWAVSMLNTILSATSSSLMDVVFFMLYSAFMLFDPLHIAMGNEHKKATPQKRITKGWSAEAGQLVYHSFRSRVSTWMSCLPCMRPRSSEGRDGQRQDLEAPMLDKEEQGVAEGSTGKQGEAERPTGQQPRPVLVPTSTNEFDPEEVQHYIYRIVWNYFLITLVINAVFGFMVFLLLSYLHLDLAVIISALTFLLSFIPELGAIIASSLPIPFILLTPTDQCIGLNGEGASDSCITDFGQRLQNLAIAFAGFFAIKLLVSNILAAYLIGSNKVLAGSVKDDDEEVQETHGVLVLFAVVFFGKVWGTVGMLISVPLISILRLSLNFGKLADTEAASRRSMGHAARFLTTVRRRATDM